LVAQHVASSHAHALLDRLFQKPVMSVKAVAEVIGRSYPTANQLVSDFERLGLLKETTGQYRNRLYSYEPYRALLR
jgi:predicted transcriptional regulator